MSFYRTYEELKLCPNIPETLKGCRFYRTYEELKLFLVRSPPILVRVFIVPMRN